MGARPGQNNFAKDQQKKVKKKIALVNYYLKHLPKGRKFETVNELAKYCADKIGCHRTTITTTELYMNPIILKFLELQPNNDLVNPLYGSHAHFLHALKSKDCEIEMLTGEKERLTLALHETKHELAYFKSDDFRREILSEKPQLLQPSNENPDDTVSSSDLSLATQRYEYTCQALKKLVDYLEQEGLGISFQHDNGKKPKIVDSSLGGLQKTIVDGKVLSPFTHFLNLKG